jgi:hypothetical protein
MEMDTEDEDFIQDAELWGYFNTGVTIIESELVKLGLRDMYLKKEALISAVAGTSDYPIPTDIVANKIRKVVYRNGLLVYTVSPARYEGSFEDEDVQNLYAPNEYYNFQIYKVAELNIFRISPKASVSVSNAFRIIYHAKLNRYTADAVDCDVPDVCYEFLLSYVRYRIYGKEIGHPNTMGERADMQNLLGLMRETLQNQVADPDMDLMDSDTSHYEEST